MGKPDGFYIGRRDLDRRLRDIYQKNPLWILVAQWIIYDGPYFSNGRLKRGEVDASYEKICEVFNGEIISRTSHSRLMASLKKNLLIDCRRKGMRTITRVIFYDEIQNVKSGFKIGDVDDLKERFRGGTMPQEPNGDAAGGAEDGGQPALCQAEVIYGSSGSHLSSGRKSFEAGNPVVGSGLCNPEPGMRNPFEAQAEAICGSGGITYNNKEEKNYQGKKKIPNSNSSPTGSKTGGRTMDMRAMITPRVRQAVDKKPRAPKVEPDSEREFPSSKAILEGFKNEATVVNAFRNAVTAKYPDVPMGEKHFPLGGQTDAAARAIDWVRESVCPNIQAEEPILRAFIEDWIRWYVSNKIDHQYRFKRSPLTMMAFFQSRNGYFAAKDANDVIIHSSMQRKVAVVATKQTVMESFSRMLGVAKESPKPNLAEALAMVALGNKGIVLTCLYLEHSKLSADAVETVRRVVGNVKKMPGGNNIVRKIYSSTWRYRSKAVAKGLVPYSDWESAFGSEWAGISMLEKTEGSDADHAAAEEFFLQLSANKV